MYILSLIVSVFFLFFSPNAQAYENALIGKLAPDAILSKSDGTTGSILDSRQGKRAIVVFWATWCPHCYEELGYISENIEAIEKQGTKIILVDIGETKEDVNNYFKERHMKLISFLDMDGVMQESYRLIGIPTVMFIDERGIIRNETHSFPSDYANYFGNS